MSVKNQTRTIVFVCDSQPVIAVVTLTKVGSSSVVRSNVSIRAAVPQPVEDMLFHQSTWQAWLRSGVDGETPALPSGWRVSDGGLDAPTPRPPNHHH